MNGLAAIATAPMNARERPPSLPPAYEAAILWSIRLSSEDATDEDRAAFREWIVASSTHEHAWRGLGSSMDAFEVVGRRQARRGGLAEGVLRRSRSRRSVLSSFASFGLVGTAAASIANRFVPLNELTADHLTRTGQVERVAIAGGASLVLGPRTAVDVANEGAVRTVSLIEGEVLLDAMAAPLSVRMKEMTLSATRGSFVGRRRNGVSLVYAVDAPGLVTFDGATSALEPGHSFSFDGARTQTRATSARTETGWVEGKLFADNETLAEIVDRFRPYVVGVVRVDPAVARLSVTGLFLLDDIDLAFAEVAQALDVSVRRITPFWVVIGPVTKT